MDGSDGGSPGGPRQFLRDDDLSPAEQAGVLALADAMKAWLLERASRPGEAP
jgi:hypothetical protein